MDNKDCLIINKITKKQNKIEYDYNAKGKWKELLNMNEKMYIEYDMNIEKVPNSIAVIPFLCNIIPISFVFDLEIVLDEIDKSFFECVPKIKEGYANMYPKISMLGNLIPKKVIENLYIPERTGTLFSGGVDATNTLLQHINEKPILFTLWGADVNLKDKNGWNIVKEHHVSVAKEYGLECCFMKTNFRSILNMSALSNYVFEKVNGEWWHDFQHGIAILGHVSLVAYLRKIGNLYIASSNTENSKLPCASDPTIDNYLRFASCTVVHDGYEFNRQDKIHNICKYLDSVNKKYIPLRVCWKSNGGENCCECEKCYRTIIEIIAEGKDPNNFGFNLSKNKRDKMMKKMPKLSLVKYNFANYYSDAQKRFLENFTENETPFDLKWFRNFKMKSKKPEYLILSERILKKIKIIIKKILFKK